MKEKSIAIGGFAFSAFLLLCAAINFFSGQLGAAIGSLGSSVFFFALSWTLYKKEHKS